MLPPRTLSPFTFVTKAAQSPHSAGAGPCRGPIPPSSFSTRLLVNANVMNSTAPSVLRRVSRLDLIIAVGSGVLAGAVAALLYSRLSFTMYHLDVWFDSDSILVFDQITNRWSDANDTNSRHPIFSLLTYPVVFLLHRILGVPNTAAALVLLIASSAACVSAMYVALRLLGRPVRLAAIYTGVFLASGCGFLYLGIHERFILGALSILLCVIAFCLHERRLVSATWLMLAAAFSLGITITNFIVGVAALVLALGWRKGTIGAMGAVALIGVLSVASVPIFPRSSTLINVGSWPMQSTVLTENQERLAKGGTVVDRAVVYWLQAVVLPTPEVQKKPAPWTARFLSIQKVGVKNQAGVWYIAALFWLALLGTGLVRSLYRTRAKADVLLAVSILGQLALFLVFGTETVLYAAYYVPLLILVASKPCTERKTNELLIITSLVFLAILLWNNGNILALSIRVAMSLL